MPEWSGPGPDPDETFFRVDFPTPEMASLAVSRLTSAIATTRTIAALAGIPSAVILQLTALSGETSWYANLAGIGLMKRLEVPTATEITVMRRADLPGGLTLLVGHQADRP
jgi:hypothetical protein